MYRSHLEESALDVTKREELRQAEIELMRQRERVAVALDQDEHRGTSTPRTRTCPTTSTRDIDLLTPAWHRLDLTRRVGVSGTPGSITEATARW